jgi:hypothetical protein
MEKNMLFCVNNDHCGRRRWTYISVALAVGYRYPYRWCWLNPNVSFALDEDDLKDLFGINEDPTQAARKHHYQNRGGAFGRLLRASLFYDVPSQKLDFCMELINMVLDYAIRAMQHRIHDVDEENLMFQDAGRVMLWSGLLVSRSNIIMST